MGIAGTRVEQHNMLRANLHSDDNVHAGACFA